MRAIIGLEIHAQLNTRTKLFCACSTDYFGSPPNAHCCPVCLGMPGALPVCNGHAIELALRAALALDCEIPELSKFDRKNYFYPDLPKGYQISQYDEPLALGGHLSLELPGGDIKRIRLRRIHIEEDAGKTIHVTDNSLLDLNRCGIPLIEIVTEPDLSSPQEASLFMSQLRQVLRYAGVSSGDMEKGELRCDANISISADAQLGTKTEIKNMNSFRAVEEALQFEGARQRESLASGKKITQQTFGWNPEKNRVEVQRSKEEAEDYRYFPDPDLVPVIINQAWLQTLRSQMPELPAAKRMRWARVFQLPAYDIQLLTDELEIAQYFEAVVERFNQPKIVSNWIMSELLRLLKDSSSSGIPIAPKHFAHVLQLVEEGKINRKSGKEVIEEAFRTGKSPEDIIASKGHSQISDEKTLIKMVDQVMAENEDVVKNFRAGNQNALGFLVGQVMAKSRGQANPKVVAKLLQKELDK
ncbi:Asp-tRNA(Asn)/Glu-tRNA(Gln) amidotransferase subunit GatB [Candidatus Acetothermia bacterium]|nr:Asp-tRNA(Asn)/Glu-tRNA(Gln) amidotransferase subunit GatB [Candidatus Acetothermia bacterium]MBI3642918.1 Asp-tRNA(Asn)/Glu-tRNA(Gln) amidotransferase subunit GatB [Candidatus Acetothermia bacterium]